MSRIMLLGGDGGLEYRLSQFPGNVLGPVAAAVVERPDFDIRSILIEDHLPDIAVFGPQVSRQTSMSLASLLEAMHPQISVVLVAEPTSDLVLEAMRSGIPRRLVARGQRRRVPHHAAQGARQLFTAQSEASIQRS